MFTIFQKITIKNYFFSNSESQQVILAFHDGAISNWDLGSSEVMDKPSRDIMYGPMPCKPITIINRVNDLKVFQGGLPRASFGDKYSITAMSLQDHVVFDFSSKGKDTSKYIEHIMFYFNDFCGHEQKFCDR